VGRPVSARSLVLDAGALIGIDDRDRRIAVLIQRSRELGTKIVVPSAALAQAWRDGSRQVNLARLLRADDVAVVNLTGPLARAVGELCARTGSRDIVDASVVIVARQRRGAVATSDPGDLRQLDPGQTIVPI